MSIVHIQFAVDQRPGLLRHLRAIFDIGNDVSDAQLLDRWLDDLVRTNQTGFARRKDRFGRIGMPDANIFEYSHWGANHRPRKMLGYDVLLQAWDEDSRPLPVDDDDIPRSVIGAPAWLNRMIVAVWAPVGWHGSEVDESLLDRSD